MRDTGMNAGEKPQFDQSKATAEMTRAEQNRAIAEKLGYWWGEFIFDGLPVGYRRLLPPDEKLQDSFSRKASMDLPEDSRVDDNIPDFFAPKHRTQVMDTAKVHLNSRAYTGIIGEWLKGSFDDLSAALIEAILEVTG